MSAYDDAAPTYLAGGWCPIPVHGKTVPVKGATGYEGTVTPEKVAGWLVADLTQRAINKRGSGMDNIGLRHQRTLAVDVDHGYGDKNGVEQLALYAQKLGLPPLPATWSSTARGDDTPSRQYLYRLAEDVTFATKPCKSVEVCCWHHRFTVCAPTIHPITGTPYKWYLPGNDGVPPSWGAAAPRYPAPDDLAPLPAEWLHAFRGGVANADKSATVVDLPELFATFTPGPPDGLVQHLIDKWSDEGQHVGHDEAKNALINCFMVGREGHPGVADLYQLLIDRYTTYLNIARPTEADREVRNLVTACATIAQQKPVTPIVVGRMPTPAEFMAGARVYLTPITMPVPAPQDDDLVLLFVNTYTRYGTPARLGRRTAWMKTDNSSRLAWHAGCLVNDVLAGHYPGDRALRALADAYRHHGGQDPHGARSILSMALSAVLVRRSGAAA